MRIGIIGAGRMGCALAIALDNEGFTISGIYSRSAKSAKILNRWLESKHKNNLALTVHNADLIFITVPDSAISGVAENITGIADTVDMDDISGATGNEDIKGKSFLHCSGALTADELNRLKVCGGYTGSLHPIQTFADRENDWKGLYNIYFGFEGDDRAKKSAEPIVKAFKGKMLVNKKEDKPVYHSVACILSNYMVSLSYIAAQLLDKIGIDPDTGIKAFLPLTEKTLGNLDRYGVLKALTGPISRGDYTVVEEHVKRIDLLSSDISEIYKALGRVAAEIALKRKSIDSYAAEMLNKILFKS